MRHTLLLALSLALVLLTVRCTPPALQLQREARDVVRSARAPMAWRCREAAAAAEAAAYRSYPEVSLEAAAARDRMREACAPPDEGPRAPAPAARDLGAPQPPADLMTDEGQHVG